MPRSYTVEERTLFDALAERGVEVRIHHLRRLRDLGLLPPSGAGNGYDVDASIPVVQLVARALAEDIKWKWMPAVLFGQGCDVPIGPLVDSFHQIYGSVTDGLPPSLSGVDADAANDLIKRNISKTRRSDLGAEWIERSGDYGARLNGRVGVAIQSLFTLMLEPDMADHIDQKTLGSVAGMGDDPERTIEFIAAFANLQTVLRVADSSTIEDFRNARTLLRKYALAVERFQDPAVLEQRPGLAEKTLDGLLSGAAMMPVMNIIQRIIPGINEALDEDWMS